MVMVVVVVVVVVIDPIALPRVGGDLGVLLFPLTDPRASVHSTRSVRLFEGCRDLWGWTYRPRK